MLREAELSVNSADDQTGSGGGGAPDFCRMNIYLFTPPDTGASHAAPGSNIASKWQKPGADP